MNSSPKILGGEPAAVLLERIRAERDSLPETLRDRTSTPKQRGKTPRKNSSKQLLIAYGRPEVNEGIE